MVSLQYPERGFITLTVIVEPGEDGGFVAHVPALRGCSSQGATRPEAVSNIRQAVEAWLEVEPDNAERPAGPVDVELLTI